MSYLSNCRWAARETVRGLRNEPGPFLFSTVLTSLALAVPLFIALVFYGLSEPLRNLPLAVEMPIFTDGSVPVEKVAEDVGNIPGVAETLIIPKDVAFAELNETLGVASKKNAKTPLPDILIATLETHISGERIAETVAAVEALKGVDVVSVETSWHERLGVITRAANTGLAILGVAILALIILVIMGALRRTNRSATEEMRALHLFGASPVFAVRPTAWRGVLMMTAASILALGLTKVGLWAFGNALAEAAALYQTTIVLTLPAWRDCAVFVVFCAVTGGIVASFAALDLWRRVR